MTITLSQVDVNSFKFIDLYNKINEILLKLQTNIVTTDSDSTPGNAIILGRLTAGEVFEGGNRVVTVARRINTGSGLVGGGNLSQNRTIALSSATEVRLAKADTALQVSDFNNKIGLKTKISVPNDISASGEANSQTFLNGAGSWVKLNPGVGDMLSFTYDPEKKQANAFDMAFMKEGTNAKIMTPFERAEIISLRGHVNNFLNNRFPAIENSFVKRDGSVPFTGRVNINSGGIGISGNVNIGNYPVTIAGKTKINNEVEANSIKTTNTLSTILKSNKIELAGATTSDPTIGLISNKDLVTVSNVIAKHGRFENQETHNEFYNSNGEWLDNNAGIFISDNKGVSARIGVARWSTNGLVSGLSSTSSIVLKAHRTGPTDVSVESSGNVWVRGGINTNSLWSRNDVTGFSDISIKDDLKVIENPLKKLKKISGYTFTRKDMDDKNKRFAGLIAQEVEKILPEVVSEHDGIKGISYGNVVSLLVEAIKELTKKVENLEKKSS